MHGRILKYVLGIGGLFAVGLLLYAAGFSGTSKNISENVSENIEASFRDRVAQARLENGLEIIVISDRRAPVVTHMVWYRVGSADEPPGKSGIAHYFEHLMFKGTEKIAPGDFSKTVAALGGQDNAFTSYDYTAYFQRIAADKLPLVMEMEADRMRNLVLTDAVTAAERDVVLEERASRTDSNPTRLLGEKLRKYLHAGHSYSIPVIGWRDEINRLNTPDALTFYRRYYAPDNAILVVVGDTDMTEVKALAAQFYGPVTPSNNPRQARPDPLPLTKAHTIRMRDARTRQPVIHRIYRLPAWQSDTAREFAALDLLMHILAGGSTGRLYQKLVVEQRLAAGISGWADTGRLDHGEAALYITPVGETHVADILSTIETELERLKSEPVTVPELARAKTQFLANTLFARDSQQVMARIYGAGLTTGFTVADIEQWPVDIAAVTADDIRRAADRFLQISQSVTGILLPENNQQAKPRQKPQQQNKSGTE